jgi:cbb3-type cytochrome oxidase cytochrome c subunit
VKGLGGREPRKKAPDLTEIALRHSPAWLHSFVENPLNFHPESKMPIYGPPTLTHQEIERSRDTSRPCAAPTPHVSRVR